jgi:glycosyltransferase involved in cell wall biosynthesis
MKYLFSNLTATVLLIAPYSFKHTDIWYSPGRSRKLQQVEDSLRDLGFSIYSLSTLPVSLSPSHLSIRSLCTSSTPCTRLIQILYSTFRLIPQLSSSVTPNYILWVYNCRVSEFLPALIIHLFRPSIPIFLQLEDLPFARTINSGIRGFIDLICLQFLSVFAKDVFVVSHNVGVIFQRITPFSNNRFTILPPALSASFLSSTSSRSEPLSSTTISILYAGGYSPEKGVATLLNTFFRLPPERFSLMLVGHLPDQILSLSSTHSNILCPGHVSSDSLFYHYARADVVVCPHVFGTRSSFIFPFKLIEYIASGSIPLTTPMPGLEDFGLPSACFFRTSDELYSRLINIHSLWKEHSETLLLIKSKVRQHFSSHFLTEQLSASVNPYSKLLRTASR